MIVGGREFNMTKHQVEAKMRGETPDTQDGSTVGLPYLHETR